MPGSGEQARPSANGGAPLPAMPITTYRLQFHSGFTLADAERIIPYLASLGVTDCYCSPIFTATPGSTHGYDVCRHTEVNPELGGEGDFLAFAAELRRHGLGCILDFVPNHMSNDPHTNQWKNVLDPAAEYESRSRARVEAG
jgi:(1->4)-alpha-D-glucan 1-alpha-D-glucosylmutase